METQWVNGKVTEVTHWTEALFSIKVDAPIYPFKAGQFAKLGAEIDGEFVERAYSFVNAPSNSHLEFYLVNVPEGKLTPHLHQLNVGDDIAITNVASGFFVLEEIPDCDTLWMMATGTGIGPYLSILEENQDLERFKRIVLIHAVRYEADLSYLPVMRAIEQKLAGKVIVQPIVSREACEGALRGRIPELIANGQLESAVGLEISPESSHIMLCGNPKMVADTKTLLREQRAMMRHLRRKPGHITSEHYW